MVHDYINNAYVKFEDTKGVFRIRQLKNKKYNDQQNKKTNNG